MYDEACDWLLCCRDDDDDDDEIASSNCPATVAADET